MAMDGFVWPAEEGLNEYEQMSMATGQAQRLVRDLQPLRIVAPGRHVAAEALVPAKC